MVCVFVKRPRSTDAPAAAVPHALWTRPTMLMTRSLPLLTLALLLLTHTLITLTPTAAASYLPARDDPAAGRVSRSSHHYPLSIPSPFSSSSSSSSSDDLDDCDLCFATDDPLLCRSCYGRGGFAPRFYDVPSQDDVVGDDVLASVPRQQKRSYWNEPMQRYQRGSGCTCCAYSRMTNANCCEACRMTTQKRKRSGSVLTSDDAAMMSRERNDVTASADCRCCLLSGSGTCCGGCLAL